MIRYLGSKRSLLPLITLVLRQMEGLSSCIDLFSGSARVGQALKAEGYQVLSNDLNAYAEVLARCYVQTDSSRAAEARDLIEELNALPSVAGWFTKTYCEDAGFFQTENGRRIDAIRESIQERNLDPELEAVALTSLLDAADNVANVMGLQMAFLKDWHPMSFKRLDLQTPTLLPPSPNGKCQSFRMDAAQFVREHEADVIYMDPPYTASNYLGLYHIWESLVLWDKPEVYGVAKKRVDVRTRKSAFNAKAKAVEAMRDVVNHAKAKVLVVSFSDEGLISRSEMVSLLEAWGHVHVIDRDYKRYAGAVTGIHNQHGEKVGEVSHTDNVEYIFVAAKDPAHVQAVKRLTDRPSILDFFG